MTTVKSKRPVTPNYKEMVGLPYKEKLAITQTIVERNLRDYQDRCVASLSGGKDSTLVTHLVLSVAPNTPVIFEDTGVEYPETTQFIRELVKLWEIRLTITKAETTFWKCVNQMGFFPRVKNNRDNHKGNICCYHLKEKPYLLAMKRNNWTCIFTGTTAPESHQRRILAMTHGTCYTTKNEGIHKVHPILYWTEGDVWQYTLENSLPVNPLYWKGADRVGCATCTAYKVWKEQLSLLNPKLYQLVCSRLRELEGADRP